jgi:hypothetical protein
VWLKSRKLFSYDELDKGVYKKHTGLKNVELQVQIIGNAGIILYSITEPCMDKYKLAELNQK